MPPVSGPKDEFGHWACARLRVLYEARCEDHRCGTSRKNSKFGAALRTFMAEYESQPFARASHSKRYDSKGRLIVRDEDLRKMADNFLRNHSVEPLAMLKAYEKAGGVACDHPFKAAPAMELWAGTVKERINELVCIELGIPTDTATADRPDTWIGARKTVVKREFELLPEVDRKEWRETALFRKVKMDAETSLPMAVQARQEQFNDNVSHSFNKALAKKGLGNTFFVSWQGFYVGAHNFAVQRIRGQSSSFDASMWHESEGYKDDIAPLWTKFIREQCEGYNLKPLPKMPKEPSAAQLDELRRVLKSHLETMFDFLVDQPTKIDPNRFWAEVAERPFDFVAHSRLPEGGAFGDPTKLVDKEFRILYHHVYYSQAKRDRFEPDELFSFEQSAVEAERLAVRAMELKAAHDKRRQKASKATAAATPMGTAQDSTLGQLPASNSPAGSASLVASSAALSVGNDGPAPTPAPVIAAGTVAATALAGTVAAATAPAGATAPASATTASTAAATVSAPASATTASTAAATVSAPASATAASTATASATAASTATASAPSPDPPARATRKRQRRESIPAATATATTTSTAAASALSPNPPAPAARKRRRRESIPPATAEQLAEMGESLASGGYKTRNRTKLGQ